MSWINNLMGRAIIRQISDMAGRQSHQVEVTKGETIDDVPRMQNYGMTSVPPAEGTDCIVAFLGGSRDQGVVIVAENMACRIKGLKSGDVAIYDNRGNIIKLTAEGIEVVAMTELKAQVGSSSLSMTTAGVDIVSLRLTHNGVNIGSTHQHLNSGGQGLGGVPAP